MFTIQPELMQRLTEVTVRAMERQMKDYEAFLRYLNSDEPMEKK